MIEDNLLFIVELMLSAIPAAAVVLTIVGLLSAIVGAVKKIKNRKTFLLHD